MPRSPVVRQLGSLKGNSRRCQVDGIKPVWGVLPIVHGDSSSSPVPGALNNSSLAPGVRSLLLSSSSPAPGALNNSSPAPGVRSLLLSSSSPVPGAPKPPLNSSKRLPPMEGAVLDSPGVNLTSRHQRSKDGDNLPNSSQLQHLHLQQVAIRVCHHGSKDQALGKVRDLAPLV